LPDVTPVARELVTKVALHYFALISYAGITSDGVTRRTAFYMIITVQFVTVHACEIGTTASIRVRVQRAPCRHYLIVDYYKTMSTASLNDMQEQSSKKRRVEYDLSSLYIDGVWTDLISIILSFLTIEEQFECRLVCSLFDSVSRVHIEKSINTHKYRNQVEDEIEECELLGMYKCSRNLFIEKAPLYILRAVNALDDKQGLFRSIIDFGTTRNSAGVKMVSPKSIKLTIFRECVKRATEKVKKWPSPTSYTPTQDQWGSATHEKDGISESKYHLFRPDPLSLQCKKFVNRKK
jgi:hypothetical protein